MLDLRSELRQSCDDVKPRNVCGRCQKTTKPGAADCGEYRQAVEAIAQDLPLSASGAWLTDVVLATTGMDWANRSYPRAGQPSIVAMLRNGTADYRRHRHLDRDTRHRFAPQRAFRRRRWPR
jgi:hypothetical protein